MKYIAFCLLLIGVLFSQTQAQSLLKNEEIPSDLLISLMHRSDGRSGQYSSKITIDAAGNISSESHSIGGLPTSRIVNLYPEKKKITRPDKVSPEKLRNLIREFEKIQFFRFGADFPVEEGGGGHTNHQDTEEISIRVNGQTKTVSNYLGDSLKRTRMLRELGVRITSAGLWDLQDGKIPEDFEVTHQSRVGEWIERDIRIGADGTITKHFYTLKPAPEGQRASARTRSKTTGRLSKEQMVRLINEFESVAFSIFFQSTEMNKYYGCTNDPPPGPRKADAIGVRIYGGHIWASLYMGCGAQPQTEAARFEQIQTVIESLLKEAKAL